MCELREGDGAQRHFAGSPLSSIIQLSSAPKGTMYIYLVKCSLANSQLRCTIQVPPQAKGEPDCFSSVRLLLLAFIGFV
jgi:hypothetical protein